MESKVGKFLISAIQKTVQISSARGIKRSNFLENIEMKKNKKIDTEIKHSKFENPAAMEGPAENNKKYNEDNIIIQEFENKGLITLNRPEVLNCLNLPMMERISSVLREWKATKNAVIIRGTGRKAFCAGGDLKELFTSLSEADGLETIKELFRAAFTLNHQIAVYEKPFVALLNGVVLGAGVGISIHGKYRIATETTLFGMPEIAIGAVPGYGGTYFFPRMIGKLGYYLGYTGHILKGIDVKLVGFATHYVSASKLPELTEALLAPENNDVGKILNSFDDQDETAEFSLAQYSDQIKKCFSGETIEDIISRLKEDGSQWAQRTLHTLNDMSPTALKTTEKAFKRGIKLSLAECLQMEYSLAQFVIQKESDFVEGVRALMIERDRRPIWNPRTLDQVTDKDIGRKFIPIPVECQLKI